MLPLLVAITAAAMPGFQLHPRLPALVHRHRAALAMTADKPDLETDATTRRSALRYALYAGWAVATVTSVSRVLDFPPASFRTLAREIYMDAQAGALGAAAGRSLQVLEIGAGAGLPSVFEDRFVAGSDVLGVDVDAPAAAKLREAEARAVSNNYAFRFSEGDATALRSLADGSVDVVLSSLTLCSVSSCEAAVAEAYRVLRPGGRFGFVEHVATQPADGRPLLGAAQAALDPAQQALAHNCHLRRDTPRVVLDAFGEGSALRMQRTVEEAMWPVSMIASGVVVKRRERDGLT